MQREVRAVLFLQFALRTLRAAADRLGLVSHERARRVGVVELRTLLVDADDQERHTKRTAHERLVVLGVLAEPQRKIAHGIRNTLDLDSLVVDESVVLARHTRMVDHGARVRGEPAHRSTQVRVDLHDFLDRACLEQRRLHALLDAEHDALGRHNAHGRRAELDGLKRILDLEQPPLGRECIDTPVCISSDNVPYSDRVRNMSVSDGPYAVVRRLDHLLSQHALGPGARRPTPSDRHSPWAP